MPTPCEECRCVDCGTREDLAGGADHKAICKRCFATWLARNKPPGEGFPEVFLYLESRPRWTDA